MRLAAAFMASICVIGLGQAHAQPLTAEPPPPAAAMGMYQTVNQWVRAWDVPRTAPDDGIEPVAGASITLRLGGTVIGRGSDMTGDRLTVWRAARQALSEAAQRLPGERDALWEQNIRESAQRTTITLELAGSPIPMDITKFIEATTALDPGVEGVAVRLGERIAAHFPEMLLATRTQSGAGMASLVSSLMDDPVMGLLDPGTLRQKHGFVFYRFHTTTIAQTSAGDMPIFLHRGGQLVGRDAVTGASLARYADGLAQHLMLRRWPGVERLGMLGTLDPCKGQYDPQIASPVDQAAAAYALLRYATAPGVSNDTSAAATSFATHVLQDLCVTEPGQPEPGASPADAAMCIIAILELPGETIQEQADLMELLLACRKTVVEAFDVDAGFDSQVPDTAKGLIADALASLAMFSGTRSEIQTASAAVRTVFRQTNVQALPSQMPWLGWAEIKLAGPGRAIPAGVVLRQMRDLVWGHQITKADAGPEAQDLVGGIVFTKAKNPLPTWNAARPVAFCASMLGDDRLTDRNEILFQLATLIDSLRFLRQLSAGNAEAHMYRDRDRALWGVRSALWDQRMPIQASAMTLLALGETLESIESATARLTSK